MTSNLRKLFKIPTDLFKISKILKSFSMTTRTSRVSSVDLTSSRSDSFLKTFNLSFCCLFICTYLFYRPPELYSRMYINQTIIGDSCCLAWNKIQKNTKKQRFVKISLGYYQESLDSNRSLKKFMQFFNYF